jgi:hypothetical protein
VNESLPVPPRATSGALVPGLSQPRVVATRTGKVSAGATPPSVAFRLAPKIWPIWKLSFPAPPSSVTVTVVSSEKNESSPVPPKTFRRALRPVS